MQRRHLGSEGSHERARSWMLYGAAGHTGALIAQHAHQHGHRPLLAGRSAPAIAALAGELDLPHRALALDDPAALSAALAEVDLVLNAAGPFLHTAAPLAAGLPGRGRALPRHRQRAAGLPHPLRPGPARPASRRHDHPRRRVRRRGHQLPSPLRQRRRRRRPAPRSRRPGRHRPARPRHRGIGTREPPLRRLDPPGRPAAPATARLGHHHDHPARRALPHHALPHRGPGSSLPGHRGPRRHRVLPRTRRSRRSIPRPPIPARRDPRPTGHSGGREPPARTAPPPKRGCKPASPTPLPPPPASAP